MEERKKAIQNLKIAKGQIEGIIKMIEDERYCIDISNQIIAVQSLLKKSTADEQRKGGLGILLMRKYMDDLRYTRADGRNILRMTKRFV